MKVREKKAKDAWESFCHRSSDEEEEIDKVKASKVLDDDEIQKIVREVRKQNAREIPRTPAPFFGPARKFGEENC
jgi:Glu-tRNA(Gln) amidotransferase subunit E-like FAD-binding protein